MGHAPHWGTCPWPNPVLLCLPHSLLSSFPRPLLYCCTTGGLVNAAQMFSPCYYKIIFQVASWNRCSSVCTLLLLAESALCKEQIALLLSFWSKERAREKIPTQMMLGFVSGCLAMVHLGVCLLLLFSPSLVLLADGFFCAFLPQPIFFLLWSKTLLPLPLNFLSSNTLVFVLPKSFSVHCQHLIFIFSFPWQLLDC